MKLQPYLLALPLALAALLAASGCDERGSVKTDSATGVRQTGFPGQITAGGGSSGAVMARTARPETDASYAGGTPGIAGGSGGTTGGAATAGSVQETGQGPSSGTSPQTSSAPAAGSGAPGAQAGPGAAPATTTDAAGAATPRGGTAPQAGQPQGSGAIPSPAEQSRKPIPDTR